MGFSKMRQWILILCCCTLAMSAMAQPAPSGERPSAALVIVDVMPTRVVGLAATALGAGLFVITFPFTAFSGPEESLYALVVDPFRYTFVRPLGKFDHWEEDRDDYFDPAPVSSSNAPSATSATQEAPPEF